MTTIDSSLPGRRTIVVDVDDSDLAACSLMVRVDGASIIVHLDAEQAMSVGSALCAKGLTGRDLPSVTLRQFEDAYPPREVVEDLRQDQDREDALMGFTDADRQAEAREWTERRRELERTFDDALGQGRN